MSVAQQNSSASQPQVKVHMLNVCAPSPEEKGEISAALSRVPKYPVFSADFEVDRGRSLLDQRAGLLAGLNAAHVSSDPAGADFVRIRREFAGESGYLNVQYSFSRDEKQMVETLVFRVREPKDLLQVSIEDSASTVTSAAAMLQSASPASRIKLERFGKSSVVLARCPGSGEAPPPDQTAYEPLFASASSILAQYRGVLEAKTTVPAELARIRSPKSPAVQKHSTKSTPK